MKQIICVSVLACCLSGCALLQGVFGPHKHKPKNDVPPPPIDTAIVWLVVVGVLGFGSGVALAVILPGDDHIPYGVAAGFGAVLITALLLKVIQTILIWGCVAAVVLALLWVAYRIYKRKALERLIEVTT